MKASNAAKCEVIVKTELKTEPDTDASYEELIGIKAEPAPVKRAKKRKAPKEAEELVMNGHGEVDEVEEASKPRKAKRAKKVKPEENDVNLDWLAAI